MRVPPGWSGRVSPSRPDYDFTPASTAVGPVKVDTYKVDFTAKLNLAGRRLKEIEKRALVDKLRLHLYNVGVVSEERLGLADGARPSQVCALKVRDKLLATNFRVQQVERGLTYDSPAGDVVRFAKDNDLAFVVQVRGVSKQFDKFGDFFLFEATVDAKVVKSYGAEPIAERNFRLKGTRKLDERQAAEEALTAAGEKAVDFLTDEVVRKRDRLFTTLITLKNVDDLRHVDNILRELNRKPGIAYASLERWSEKGHTAIVEVTHSGYGKENLGAYLETLRSERVEVEEVTKDYINAGRD
jgi:hypothetical protein